MSKAPQGQVLPRRTGWFGRQQPTPPSLMVAQPLTEEEALAEIQAQRDAEEAAKRSAEEAIRIKEEARRAKEEARRIRDKAKRAEAEARREEKARQAEELRRRRQEEMVMRRTVTPSASAARPAAVRAVRFNGQRLSFSLGTVGCVMATACICVLILGAYSIGWRSASPRTGNGMAPAAAVLQGDDGTVRTPLLPMSAKPQKDAQKNRQKQPAESNPDLSELLRVPAARKANLVAPNQPAAVDKEPPQQPQARPSGPPAEELNYLQIESFNVTRYRSGDQLKDDVEAVRTFLGQRGVNTFARRLGNRYVLFSEPGFLPGAQNEAQRDAFRKKIDELGKEYRKAGGLYEFKNCLFVSYATTRGGQPA